MFSSRAWITALSVVAVVCCAVLVTLSNSVAVGALSGIVAIGCISCLYATARRSRPGSEPKERETAGSSSEAVARAIEEALGGSRPDVSALDEKVAAAISGIVDQLGALEGEIAELSPSDELTSLAKEDVFNNVLWREFSRAQRYKTPLSLVLIEVEGFEQFMKSFGVSAGEELTRHVASVILQMVRETDLAARYGEDRFAVIMPGTNLQGASEFAQRLQDAVREGDFKADGGSVKVALLVGAASVPDESVKTAPGLVEKAATVLEAAKGGAKGTVP